MPSKYPFRSALVLSAASLTLADHEPQAIRWATTPVGPDGPWNAVEVRVGSGEQRMALVPGGDWQTSVVTSDYCSFNASVSHCSAGTYSKDEAIENDLNGIRFEPRPNSLEEGVQIEGRNSRMFMDEFDLGFDGGVIPNVSMTLTESQFRVYPNGDWYPMFTGCLSLGAIDPQQHYDDIYTNIIPWYLAANQTIPSSSFGLHIGSAVGGTEVSGSLMFGGYDPDRVLGHVLGFDGVFTGRIPLRRLRIEVVQGASPFDFDTGEDLLEGDPLVVRLDACSPYLSLPMATCENLASRLPLNYDTGLGLYLWDTSDQTYRNIMHSGSVLAFTLGERGSEVTINVPFQHLNLTLEPPLVDAPVSYFPCYTGDVAVPVLGRAFLQDAFVGGNLESERWWLAQAPGPLLPDASEISSIEWYDLGIEGSGIDWAATWSEVWTALDELNQELQDDGNRTTPSSNGTTLGGGQTSNSEDGNGMTTGDCN
ncbi:aspartic peptidase domain-containing protein [Stachybotrys elegans]|uniref:Aspartic peptidase domain-containing protein n=1 Tax=Stachybotrys elegans TaxID=80388 RepID=A0A8K0WS04_9HYPO|nr:aspartic peptidase domain-containing protein [Stachybotrys elegans]